MHPPPPQRVLDLSGVKSGDRGPTCHTSDPLEVMSDLSDNKRISQLIPQVETFSDRQTSCFFVFT